ncbi:MAG: ABC transporter permease subunit [Fibrobacter sp.]|nr:ABC transporter permease subunit [Fibrobacter sp.]
MKSVINVLRKEWLCFKGSDKGVFGLYLILILSWSLLLGTGGQETGIKTGPLWLIFFSVVVAANFSNTVFISERVTGSLEILITSGLSRNSILYGKMLFVSVMSIVIGGICLALGLLWSELIFKTGGGHADSVDFLIYACSVFVNVSNSAYLSVRIANPRLIHFANMFILAVIIFSYMALSSYFPVPPVYLILVLLFLGTVFTLLARREFNSERILQPVIL